MLLGETARPEVFVCRGDGAVSPGQTPAKWVRIKIKVRILRGEQRLNAKTQRSGGTSLVNGRDSHCAALIFFQ